VSIVEVLKDSNNQRAKIHNNLQRYYIDFGAEFYASTNFTSADAVLDSYISAIT